MSASECERHEIVETFLKSNMTIKVLFKFICLYSFAKSKAQSSNIEYTPSDTVPRVGIKK